MLKKVSVISMKFCTRIINVKKEYKSAIVLWWVGFSGKLFCFHPFKYWSHQFFWILYHHCNKKTLFNRNYIMFEIDIQLQLYDVWNGLFIFFFSMTIFWYKLLAEFSEIAWVFLKSSMLSSLIFFLKSTTLGCKWFV